MRIKSVKSTQKITSAMKMVAAAKLRRSQEKAERARPYAEQLEILLSQCLKVGKGEDIAPSVFLNQTPNEAPHLFVVCTSDRGLCGGFNSSIIREARHQLRNAKEKGESFKLFLLGKKAREQLFREYKPHVIDPFFESDPKGPTHEGATTIATFLENLLKEKKVGRISMVYSLFKTVLTQVVTVQQVVPFITVPEKAPEILKTEFSKNNGEICSPWYSFEPSLSKLTELLLFNTFVSQIYQALLETKASELGARMTAMDNATRNARDVIKKLELTYNRTRQGCITKELIEIISGAEAL